VEGLDSYVGQAVLDGMLSVELWGTNTKVYAPLTVVSLWKYLSKAAGAKIAWRKVSAWLSSTSINTELKGRVERVLERAPWHGFVRGVHDTMTITKASLFLGNGFLSTEHINTMLHQLQKRVAHDNILVGSVSFSTGLVDITSKNPDGVQSEIKGIGTSHVFL
jgi:hypothetical protein